MRSLVVYESLFGNTEAVARAIAEGLSRHGDAEAVTTASADRSRLDGVDLLVVGAPTHAWSLPRERTWVSTPIGRAAHPPLVREWLRGLPAGEGRPAAAFSTRLAKPRLLTGAASAGIARRLRRSGWSRAAPAFDVVVGGTEGPLGEGELARARSWGDELGRSLDRTRVGPS